MRIVIEIEGDELGTVTHPTSVTITFPAKNGGEDDVVRTQVEAAGAARPVVEDAGPAPSLAGGVSSPAGYATAPPLYGDDSVTSVAASRVVDAGAASMPVLSGGAAVVDAATEPMATGADAAAMGTARTRTAIQEPDDLTVIDGIGPKIATVLADAGIDTYERLAESEVDELQRILSDAGVRANAQTWPGQAAIAAGDDQAALDAYQEELKRS